MAYRKCSKCDNQNFEVIENSPEKSNFKLNFVQCSNCGSVVGTMEYYNIGEKIEELEKEMSKINSNSEIKNDLNIINRNLAKLFELIQQANLKIDSLDKKLNK